MVNKSRKVPITIKCSKKDVIPRIMNSDTILTFQPESSAYIRSTRVRPRPLVIEGRNITHRSQPILKQFKCENLYLKSSYQT